MNTNSAQATLFPLTIDLDPDGVDWTHLTGLTHVLTLQELPSPLQTRARNVIARLLETGYAKVSILPETFPEIEVDGRRIRPWTDVIEDPEEILRLIAWWIQWDQNRIVARGSWICPECGSEVTRRRGHCRNPKCVSWNILHLITGETILHLVPKTDTNAS